jgi:redox-regulated HSP33 family molecular chaperone
MSRKGNSQQRYHFRPCLEPLEDRTAPAAVLMGTAVQAGSLLAVNVASPGISTTVIVEDGQGNVAVEWNGGNYQTFSGINNIQVYAQGFGNIIAVYSSASLQTPETLNLNLAGMFNALFYHLPSGGAKMTAQANVPMPFIPF